MTVYSCLESWRIRPLLLGQRSGFALPVDSSLPPSWSVFPTLAQSLVDPAPQVPTDPDENFESNGSLGRQAGRPRIPPAAVPNLILPRGLSCRSSPPSFPTTNPTTTNKQPCLQLQTSAHSISSTIYSASSRPPGTRARTATPGRRPEAWGYNSFPKASSAPRICAHR